MTQLEIKKIEFNNTLALRELDEKAKDREVSRKIDLARLDDEREERKEESARKAKKDEMFAKAPEVVGTFIGKALAESGKGGVAGEAQGRDSDSSHIRKPQPGIRAGVGEAGDAKCGNCGTIMAIGPTAKVTACANCGTRYPIERVAPAPPGDDGSTTEPQPAEEEE